MSKRMVIQSRARKLRFDFFFSYASEDAHKIVAPLSQALKENGLTYYLDSEQINPGENIVKGLNYGIMKSQYVLAIVTDNFIRKPWAMTELQTVLHEQISTGQHKLIPIISGTDRQKNQIMETIPLLRSLHYIQWDNNPEDISRKLRRKLLQ